MPLSNNNKDSSNSNIDLSVSIAQGRLQFATCIYNASGPRSGSAAALAKIAQSASTGAVLTKSATLLDQTGNPMPRTHHAANNYASFNSEGLPNAGIDYYIAKDTMDEVFAAANNKKPYIVSLSGKTLADNLTMLQRIASSSTLPRIASIELNLACPNVIGKPIIGYDFYQMDAILAAVAKAWIDSHSNASSSSTSPLPPLGIKLPPYLDTSHMTTAATIIQRHSTTVIPNNNDTTIHMIAYVVSINTIGNALSIDGVASEAPYIASNAGLAGLSGPCVFPTALANVYQLRQLLPPHIAVVGVGGIATGQDVYDMLLVGASACQIATQHWKEGPGCFDRIATELRAILQSKRYTSVAQVQGQLKPWSKEAATLQRTRIAAKNTSILVASNSGGGGGSGRDADSQFYKILSILLSVLLAVALADKFMRLEKGRTTAA